ncbi:GNAT family N-acetyltransferase [Ferdinandcohnia quinoae]|uniref:GNAT family N-acetyltransferase n=1 Tax=Fredinandcohnia quinoae TaxID=2918902 RepID=A0AAW5EE33_9BACI|nr:GNAT family N-acetyltransferase [Fredinandcohnia sp. SECRCQ15]MCH1627024.1 GNAT family N-acetyltransferase [Fredinandcohnia sp. SECRCQ15]
MRGITFKDIKKVGNIVLENNLFTHVHYPEMLIMYDSNFIEFKKMPGISELKDTEKYLRDFHLKRGQNHLKFYFPENEKLSEEVRIYLTETGYESGFLELYAIRPNCFPKVNNNQDIEIKAVNNQNVENFLQLQYNQDLQYGSEFARQKIDFSKREFDDPAIVQILAFYQEVSAGYAIVNVSTETVEIDGLNVDASYRNKGIGSRLQQFVMESFPDKIVILVADGEDTPREMYKKQNYQYQGFQYEALKVFED